MSSLESAETPHNPDPNPDSVSLDVLRVVNTRHLVAAELGRINERLSETPDFKGNPVGTAKTYVDGLVKRRAELLTQPRLRARAPRGPRLYPEDLILNFPRVWSILNLPIMSEGINDNHGIKVELAPDEVGPNEIATTDLSAGGVGYMGDPTDDGLVNPHTEKWWVHNWTCSAVFPPAPFAGKLHYRFNVDGDCKAGFAPMESGLVAQFVTLGETADVLTDSPFDAPNLWDAGWPIYESLPRPGGLGFAFSGSLKIEGAIDVHRGRTAALALILGAITGVATGYVQYLPCNIDTHPPAVPIDQTVVGMIEYRFEPRELIEAVAKLRIQP